MFIPGTKALFSFMLKIEAHNSRIQETMLIENNVCMFMPRPNQMNTILA